MVARFESRVVGGNHFAHAQCPHHLAQADGGDVGFAFVHPAAHGGVEGQVQVADQDLAFGGLGGRHRFEGEVVAAYGADRAFGKEKAAVGLGHGGLVGS
ncbi:hypothetical protein D3C79_466200 [compost metagenome]